MSDQVLQARETIVDVYRIEPFEILERVGTVAY